MYGSACAETVTALFTQAQTIPETVVTVLPIREAGPAVGASTAYINTPCKVVNIVMFLLKVGREIGDQSQV